jgi:hypothetical protein
MRDNKGKFPELANLLRQLRDGFKSSGIHDIHDLLCGRKDKDFVKKSKAKLEQLNRVVKEIRAKCAGLDHPSDPRHIKYLLWAEIRAFDRSKAKPDWDAEEIGNSIVSKLEAPKEERLICLPLRGSAAPARKAPDMHPLADDVWLLERHTKPEGLGLLRKLEELVPNLPEEVVASLRGVKDPILSELGALFLYPTVVYHTKSLFSERGYLLRRYGIPLIAIHVMAIVNELDVSDDISFFSYVRPGLSHPFAAAEWGSSRCPERFVQEWTKLSDESSRSGWHQYRDTEQGVEEVELEPLRKTSPFGDDWTNMGLGASRSPVFRNCKWYDVVNYEIDVTAKRINAIFSGGGALFYPPHMLILPSLIPMELTKKLIEAGDRMDDPTTDSLLRRIGHALAMWTRAFHCGQEQDWQGGWMHEDDERQTIRDPDALTLYSTVVLETLFSSQSDKQEVTTRIADFTAGLLGNSASERYDLARRMKGAYSRRSDFVHGNIERDADYVLTAIWLFKIATLSLWKCVQLAIVDGKFRDWEKFIDYVQLRKFGGD